MTDTFAIPPGVQKGPPTPPPMARLADGKFMQQSTIDRMVNFIRDLAELNSGRTGGQFHDELQEIYNLLPQPVDPDVLAARKIIIETSMLGPSLTERYNSGEHDGSEWIRSIVAGIKHGRANP